LSEAREFIAALGGAAGELAARRARAAAEAACPPGRSPLSPKSPPSCDLAPWKGREIRRHPDRQATKSKPVTAL